MSRVAGVVQFHTPQCVEARVATNLHIPPELICEAQELGGHSTKKAAVVAALEEYVRKRTTPKIVALFGTIEHDSAYDYKAERRRSLDRVPHEDAD
jgi:hypothetical protein